MPDPTAPEPSEPLKAAGREVGMRCCECSGHGGGPCEACLDVARESTLTFLATAQAGMSLAQEDDWRGCLNALRRFAGAPDA